MFLSNSRIEKDEKILFYEQDILIDNCIYKGDAIIDINIEYINSGIGIALIKSEGLSIQENEVFLFKISNNEYSVIKRYGEKRETISNGILVNMKPYKENINLRLEKRSNCIIFYVDNEKVFDKYINSDLSNYLIGYYSNAGNCIKTIDIMSETPNEWIVNMENTNGGYIFFNSNSITLSDCLDKAEIEQVGISLNKNDEENPYYYLKYELENDSDIKPYVFLSNDNRYNDEEKNILDKTNKFKVEDDCEINVKFVGKKGTIKNIQISNNKNDFYIETNSNSFKSYGSFIKINTNDISKIEWNGIIFNTPEINIENENINEFGILKDINRIYYPQICNIELNKDYNYLLDLDLNKLTVKKDGKLIKTIDTNIINEVILFKNMDSIISKMIIYKKDGTIKNVILENTKKQYIPATINSPIILTDENNIPLDISSSYRIIKDKDGIKYRFTNIEREIFESNNIIELEKYPSNQISSIIVYGVHSKNNIDLNKILYSFNSDIDDISFCCDSFDTIYESDIYYINKKQKKFILFEDDNEINKYEYIIVDYLKDNSYAINYIHELGSYELDISTDSNIKAYYDGIDDNNNFINIKEYKDINITLKNDSYLVLRDGD